MAVADWFQGFVRRHLGRHPRPDWPEAKADPYFYRAWREHFERAALDEADADAASVRLVIQPPRFLGEHIPALVTLAQAAARDRAGDAPRTTADGPTDAAWRRARGRWDAMAEADREALRAEGRAELPQCVPLWRRFPKFLNAWCLGRLAEREDMEAIEK